MLFRSSASVVVSEVFGVSVVVVRERELKVGWGWGGVVGLKGGLEGVLKGGLGGFLKGGLEGVLKGGLEGTLKEGLRLGLIDGLGCGFFGTGMRQDVFHSAGTFPGWRLMLKICCRGSPSSTTHALRSLGLTPSGPAAFLGHSLLSSPVT